MKIQAVFIDIDNTLLDFDAYVYRTMETGFAHFGLKTFEPWMYDTFTEVNNGLWRQIEDKTLVFSELEKIRWNRVFEQLGIDFDGPTFEKYFRAALYDSAIIVDGAMEMLERLSKDYVLCAASNGPFEQQKHRLQIAGMTKYFDHVFISEDIGASKPSREFFDEAFRRLNENRAQPITPEETIIIGDSLTSDMAGGRDYRMHTCFYTRGKALPEDANIDQVITSLDQLSL